MATGAAPSTAEGGDPVDQSSPLAEAEVTESIGLGKETAMMRTRVSVQKCPKGFRSRLGYHAKLYLKFPTDPEKEVGRITAWRISKPTGANPNVNTVHSREDWGWKSLDEYDRKSIQMAYCYRALWGRGNFPPLRRESDRVVNEQKRQEISNTGNEMIYIETIAIKWRENFKKGRLQLTGKKLGALLLDHYYILLGSGILPAWYSPRGPVTYLLMPRLQHESQINQKWFRLQQDKGYSDEELAEEVRRELSRLFQKPNYSYEPYVTDATIEGAEAQPAVTVLGHVVTPEECQYEDLRVTLIFPEAT